MAIRRMTSLEEFEANPAGIDVVTNFPGHEADRFVHSYDCTHSTYPGAPNHATPECTRCKFYGPLYMKTTHVGLVLETRERNGYDDSDFYAVVWNPLTGKPENVEYATTRWWTYPNSATVDATPEVRAAYEAWVAAEREAARIKREAAEAALPKPGRKVVVVAGRNIPKGTTGVVFWFGACRYRVGFRVGVELANGERVFTAATNLEVVAP